MSPIRHLRRTPRARRLMIVLAVVVAVVVATGVTTGLAARRLQRNITAVDVSSGLGKDRPTAAPTSQAGRAPLNILVMGSDSREGANAFIGGTEDEGRSDTTLVLHVSGDRRNALAVSIPRDSMVDMPDCRSRDGGTVRGALRQFNAAYTLGGAACTQRTVEQLTGVRIDHYVVIDFAGFRDMVDALGGVEICLPHAVKDDLAHLDLPAGRSDVDGTQALAYVRSRHGLGDGSDLGRVERQQAFLSAVLQKATSAGTLTNPKRLYDFLDTATRSITVDPGLASLGALTSLARTVQSIGLDRIQFFTVPTTVYPADRNRVEWSSQAKTLWRAVAQDRPVTTTAERTSSPTGSATPSPTVSTATSPPGAGATPSPTATRGPVTLKGVTGRSAADDVCT